MKRRTFCAAGLALAASSTISLRRVRAASAEIPAMRGDGKQATLTASDVKDLKGTLRGELLLPGESGYDQARKVWNGAFDRKPALIARCVGAADVTQAVTFAKAHNLLVAVRGGGHSLSGQSVCDGGLMIDLAPMRSVHVDPAARVARGGIDMHASHGCEVDHEPSVAYGLARETVAATAHRDEQIVRFGKRHGLRHIRRTDAACDERGLTVEGAVPDLARLVVTGLPGKQELAAQRSLQVLDIRCGERCLLAVPAHRRNLGGCGSDSA